jgi:hypothetical protein
MIVLVVLPVSVYSLKSLHVVPESVNTIKCVIKQSKKTFLSTQQDMYIECIGYEVLSSLRTIMNTICQVHIWQILALTLIADNV